ncbi:MAG: DUF695 domain-containing protein [Kiloniellales bacterium]|nr:DUF695 domain-containing protein [Kiloniellales bacterium]
MPDRIRELVEKDVWALAEAHSAQGPMLKRFRTPILQPVDITSHRRVLRILWIYAEEGTGEMPSSEDSDRMEKFENLTCDALEKDHLAVLTAVVTFDGARQWVWYTSDVPACGQRINEMPQEEERYPIELDAFDDPDWGYLRNTILGSIDKESLEAL